MYIAHDLSKPCHRTVDNEFMRFSTKRLWYIPRHKLPGPIVIHFSNHISVENFRIAEWLPPPPPPPPASVIAIYIKRTGWTAAAVFPRFLVNSVHACPRVGREHGGGSRPCSLFYNTSCSQKYIKYKTVGFIEHAFRKKRTSDVYISYKQTFGRSPSRILAYDERLSYQTFPNPGKWNFGSN